MIDVFECLNKFLAKDSKKDFILEGEPTEKSAADQKPAEVSTADASSEASGESNKEHEGKESPLVYENSIDEVIVQLHNVAISKVGTGNFKLVNSAFDDPQKPTKLASTGEHVISIVAIDPSKPIEQSEAVKTIKTYVQWFIGPDASAKITEKNVYPMIGENTAKDDKDEAKAKDKKLEDASKKHKEQMKGESILPKMMKMILREATEDKISNDEDIDDKDKDLGQNKSTEKTDQKLTHANGYYTIYQIDTIPGKKDTTLQDVTKKFAKSTIRNIAGFNWMTGAAGKTIGDIEDSLDSVFGNIDPSKLVSEVGSEFKKRLPKLNPTVEVFDSKTILTRLSKSLDKKDKLKIQPVKYALAIRLNDTSDQDEKAAQKILKSNLQIVADVINKSITGFVKRVKFHIKPEHIIAVKSSGDKVKKAANKIRLSIEDLKKKLDKDQMRTLKKKDEELYNKIIQIKGEDDIEELQSTLDQFKDYLGESIFSLAYNQAKLIVEGSDKPKDDDKATNAKEKEEAPKSEKKQTERVKLIKQLTKILKDNKGLLDKLKDNKYIWNPDKVVDSKKEVYSEEKLRETMKQGSEKDINTIKTPIIKNLIKLSEQILDGEKNTDGSSSVDSDGNSEEKNKDSNGNSGEEKKADDGQKYNFFIIPMKGLDYKDSDDERMKEK